MRISDWSSDVCSSDLVAAGVCDFLQTFPSFIYLIPVVMLFKVSDLSAIIAVLLFAVVPMIRYTILGLRSVPAPIMAAAPQPGTTRLQRLLNVELPIALPEILLVVNQVIDWKSDWYGKG